MNEWSFFIVKLDIEKNDVTDIIVDNFLSDGFMVSSDVVVLLKKNHSTSNISSKSGLLVKNNKNKNWRDLYLKLDSHFVFSFNPVDNLLPVRIVYYVNSYMNDNYWLLVRSQLLDLKKNGILSEDNVTLFIVFAGDNKQHRFIEKKVSKLFNRKNKVHLECTTDNSNEFPGIDKVWSLSQENSEGLILYFHSKGISHLKLSWLKRSRLRKEKVIFSKVIGEWKKNFLWFDHIITANKLGIQSGGRGWIWYNFWWARSSYIKNLEKPYKLNRRHYYEDWLCRQVNKNQTLREDMPFSEYPNSLDECLSVANVPEKGVFNLGSDFKPMTLESNVAFSNNYTRFRYFWSK